MIMNTRQLAKILQLSMKSAYRLAKTLQFNKYKEKNKLVYQFQPEHPLVKSIQLLEGSAKPIYTISEIAKLWQWRKGYYSNERVRQLLDNYDVPIYNRMNKGLIYLSDLKRLLKWGQNTNFFIISERQCHQVKLIPLQRP